MHKNDGKIHGEIESSETPPYPLAPLQPSNTENLWSRILQPELPHPQWMAGVSRRAATLSDDAKQYQTRRPCHTLLQAAFQTTKIARTCTKPKGTRRWYWERNQSLFQLSERKYTSSPAQVCTYPIIDQFRHRNPLPRDQRGNCPGMKLHG
ncbi:MAG: hypothetical protein AAGF27_10900 [Pseudomonadota bacterium]